MTYSTSRKLDSRFLAISLVFVPFFCLASWATAGQAHATETSSGIIKAPELHIVGNRHACKVTERLKTSPNGAQRIVRHFVCEKGGK